MFVESLAVEKKHTLKLKQHRPKGIPFDRREEISHERLRVFFLAHFIRCTLDWLLRRSEQSKTIKLKV